MICKATNYKLCINGGGGAGKLLHCLNIVRKILSEVISYVNGMFCYVVLADIILQNKAKFIWLCFKISTHCLK